MNRTPLPALVNVLCTLGSYGARLTPADATPEQLRIVANAVNEARRLLAAANGPASTTGCSEHPNGPVDPTEGGACLLCRNRRPPAAGTAAAVPVEDVVQALADLGEQEAVRRFGARAVARATATAGRGTHKHSPHTRRAHDEEPTR
ncbi:hypothetical protein ACFRQM_09555 [Streptomyces sp. NPDC056831]|uniref:hypothetical protein n=1 Tax=Streptomyces sp. NPDC056831 TaxID=3345954 RepID=UPI00368EC2DC